MRVATRGARSSRAGRRREEHVPESRLARAPDAAHRAADVPAPAGTERRAGPEPSEDGPYDGLVVTTAVPSGRRPARAGAHRGWTSQHAPGARRPGRDRIERGGGGP